MSRLSIVVGLVVLMSVFPTLLLAGDPATPTYLVDRYSNNAGPGSAMDTFVRLVNVGAGGNPLTSPVGDVCANIYVFDSNQEMLACCSCRLTPNELVTASVANQLTNNPLIAIIPTDGVIKIMPTAAGTAVCSATAPSASSDASLLAGFATHLEISGPATFVTETNILGVPLGSDEAAFLTNACIFVQYLGGGYGRGTCGCTGKTYSISGTISGAGGNGATVNLSGTATATVTADAAGNYAFTGLEPGSYTATPSQAGFTFAPASLPATINTTNSANVTGVNFSTVAYSISGAISGAGGSGAVVNLTGPASATATADAAGNYSFPGLQNGSYTVTPSKTGFVFTPASQPAPVNSANVTGVNFLSASTYSISGTISGAGGSAATVNLTGAATATVTADASGNYTFPPLPNGSYTVTPSKAGFTFTPASLPAIVNNANVSGVNFSTVTYSISGTISGAGGSAATVNLTGAATAAVTADASGNYSFTGLQNGSYTVTPSKAGFTFTPASLPATVSSANVTAINFGTVSYSISGTISGAGGSASTVNLTGAATATVTADAVGNYAFTGLQNGSYTVTPSKTGFTFTPASQPATVSSANVTGVNFGTVTYSISGTISGAGGNGATVNLTGTATAATTANASGNYTFTGLQNGSYTVTPSKTGFTFTPASQPTTINSANVTGVNFGTVTYSISGTIGGPGGSAATVNLTGAATAAVTADASGNYSFTGLQNGSYTVTPSKTGFTFTPASQPTVVSSANVAGVNFSTVTYSISGTISGAGGNGATVNLTGTSSATVTADTSGNYAFTGLQNGSYTVTPSKIGFTFTPASQAATVSNANVTAINFSTVTYSISGTISGAGGNTATVNLSGAATATVTADASGNYTFAGLTNGSYTITPSKAGFSFSPANQIVMLNGANVSSVNFGTVTYSISGTISGAGSAGATVNLTGAATATVTADVSGNYTLAGLTNGAYTITPSKSGFSFSPANQIVMLSGANVSGVNFGTVTYSISGTISGAGGNGATVNLTGAATASATADASGNYTFAALTNGSYTVTPSRSGFSFSPSGQTVTLNNANVTAVNFGTVTYSISGTINGAGGNGATVNLTGTSSATVTADASGKYAFTGLTNGSYTVAPGNSGFSFSPANRPVAVNNANATAVNFSTVTYSISGTISGVGGITATVKLSGAATATVTADASGNYTFAGLTNGSYTVTPSKSGSSFSPANQIVMLNGANVSGVNFGTVTYSISGTISGAGGAGATVSLTGAYSATVIADASGNYAFSGLVNGAYSVSPSQSGFTLTPASQNVTVNNANVAAVNFSTVTYSLSGTLSGLGSNGATVTLTGATTVTVAADASGNYTLAGLNNGSYTVTPNKTGFTFNPDSQPVTINGSNITGVKFSSFQSCPCSMWTDSTVPGTLAADDPNPIELGVRLSSDVAGFITSVRFYKDATNTGRHIANLWTNAGTLLATAKFTNETASGWQQVNFANPVPIAANTTYVASYHTNAGNYSYDQNYFTSAFDNTPLHARKDGMSGANGVFVYGASAFPTSTYLSTNYYVDVVFNTSQNISGTISGPGGSGATVTLSGTSSASVTADASGNYTFTNVVNGAYTVTPSNPGFTFAPASRAVTASGADIAALNFSSTAGLAMDQVIASDRSSAGSTITSPTFSTANPNELLLAFVSTDGTTAGITVTGVSSTDGTLTWSLVRRTNTQLGTAEIWRAFSPVPLSGTSVSATLSQGVAASMTVVTFTGVDTSTTDGSGAIGATAGNNAKPGAPTASLTTTRNNSWVIGVGNDWDTATIRTVGANQTMVHQFLSASDTFWVQSQTGTTPLAGTVVTINDTAPTGDRYNLSICEVLPAP